MRLLLDESVHLKAADVLRDLGVGASHILELSLGGATDETVLAEAISRNAVLVSHDSDFHKILAKTKATQPSVIRVRAEITSPTLLAQRLIATCQSMAELIQEGAAISVDLESARGRRLPLR